MEFMEEAGVFDVGFFGSDFTWCNNRRGRAKFWKRLDRLLINGDHAGLPLSISITHLAKHPSDHAPLKIGFTTRPDDKPRPFHFLNVWTRDRNFLDVVKDSWE